MRELQDKVAKLIAAQIPVGAYALTAEDSRTLALAHADAIFSPDGFSRIEDIFRAACTRPTEYSVEGYARWASNMRAALKGIAATIRTRPQVGRQGRIEARKLADLMLLAKEDESYAFHVLALGPSATRGNVGAIRVLTHLLATSERAEHVDDCAAFLLEPCACTATT